MATADDILARLSARNRGVPIGLPAETVVSPEVPSGQPLGLPQPISEIPLGMVEQPDTAEDMLQRLSQRKAATQQIAEPPPEETDFFSRLKGLFTGEARATPETEAAPELTAQIIGRPGQRPSLKEFILAGRMLLTATEEEKKKLIEETVPDAAFRTDEKGNTFVTLPGREEAVLNRPGFSLEDALNITGMIALFTPAGRIAKGLGLGMRTFLRGGAASLTEAGREIAIEKDLDPVEVGLAGATGVAGEVAVPAVKAIGQGLRRVVGKIPVLKSVTPPEDVLRVPKGELPEARAAVVEAQTLSRELQTDFLQAQQTLDPAQLEIQAFLPSLPAGSRKAARILNKQNKQMSNAVQRFMNTIAPPESIETASGNIRNIAEQAIEAKKTLRAEIADPFYDEAKRDPRLLKLPETEKLIGEIRSDFKPGGDIDNLLKRVEKKLFTKRKVDGRIVNIGTNTKELHGSKVEIDKLINGLGTDSLSNTEKRILLNIKESYLSEIDAANPAYEIARAAFEARSPAVKELQDGIIGKIAELNDNQLKGISGILFDPAETNPTVIRTARKIIETQDPQAWRDIVRLEMEKRLGSVPPPKVGESFINRPGRIFNALFEPAKRRNVLFAGLDEEGRKNLGFLEEGLRRASLGRPGGAQTATREQIKKGLEGGFVDTIVRFIGRPASTLAEAGRATVRGATAETVFNKRVKDLTDVMFDPRFAEDLKTIRKLNPNSKAAGDAIFKLLEDVSKGSLQVGRLRRKDNVE